MKESTRKRIKNEKVGVVKSLIIGLTVCVFMWAAIVICSIPFEQIKMLLKNNRDSAPTIKVMPSKIEFSKNIRQYNI